MKMQFYAIGIDNDQGAAGGGLIARQHGTKVAMDGYTDHYIGSNSSLYAASIYTIAKVAAHSYRGDHDEPLTGAVYSVVER